MGEQTGMVLHWINSGWKLVIEHLAQLSRRSTRRQSSWVEPKVLFKTLTQKEGAGWGGTPDMDCMLPLVFSCSALYHAGYLKYETWRCAGAFQGVPSKSVYFKPAALFQLTTARLWVLSQSSKWGLFWPQLKVFLIFHFLHGKA